MSQVPNIVALTTEEAAAIVAAIEGSSEWREMERRTPQQRLALGVVIVSKIMKGKTLRALEAEMGIPYVTISRYRDLALNAIVLPTVESARAEEIARLDILIGAVWDMAETGDKDAIASYIKLSDKKAALLGLNKPIEINQTVTEVSAQEMELQQLIAQEARDNAMREAELKAASNVDNA